MARTEEILDSLVERSTRNLNDYTGNRTLPQADLPGRVSLCLDDLLEAAEGSLGMTRGGAMVQVIEQGIAAWYRGLSDEHKAILQLEADGLFQEDDCVQKTDQLQLELSNNGAEEEIDPDDPNPAAAQQQADAYAYQNGAFGYTPMTIHSLADNKGGRQGQGHKPKQGSKQNQKKRRPQSDSRKKRNRGRRRNP